MNENHNYVPGDAAGNICECGLSLYHARHFDGNVGRAAAMLRADRRESSELLAARAGAAREKITLATRVVISDDHPSLAGLYGIAVYVEEHFATIQIDAEGDGLERAARLPINVPFRFLEAVPLVVPTFTSQEEADEWLERHNPVAPEDPEVPHFSSVEEADEWAEKMRRRRSSGERRARDRSPYGWNSQFDLNGITRIAAT